MGVVISRLMVLILFLFLSALGVERAFKNRSVNTTYKKIKDWLRRRWREIYGVGIFNDIGSWIHAGFGFVGVMLGVPYFLTFTAVFCLCQIQDIYEGEVSEVTERDFAEYFCGVILAGLIK